MPIYEYRCEDCGLEFEKLILSAAQPSGFSCPSCGNSRLTRKLSIFATRSAFPNPCCDQSMCPSGESCPNAGLCRRD
jgi:putative FmdB family regulatory protein